MSNNKNTLYIMLGLPGAGKSTYVTRTLVPRGVQVICADDLRLAHGHKYYGPLENQIHGLLYTMARAHMIRGLDVVVDECTVRAAYVQRWLRLADDMQYDVKVIYIDTPIAICKERRAAEDFPLEVIDQKEENLKKALADIKVMLGSSEFVTVKGTE